MQEPKPKKPFAEPYIGDEEWINIWSISNVSVRDFNTKWNFRCAKTISQMIGILTINREKSKNVLWMTSNCSYGKSEGIFGRSIFDNKNIFSCPKINFYSSFHSTFHKKTKKKKNYERKCNYSSSFHSTFHKKTKKKDNYDSSTFHKKNKE